jgi:hypothetical protein
VTREEQLAALLAEGWAEEDLTWISRESAVSIELAYVRGQDGREELRKALALARAGQYVVKAEAVERRIRAMPGCENYRLEPLKMLDTCNVLEIIRGSVP